VQDLIWGEIERVNKQLARVEAIKKFRLIEQLLTAEERGADPDHEAQADVREPQIQGRHRRHVRRDVETKGARDEDTMLAVGVTLAAGALAGVALAQNESRGVSKTEIVLGMHTDLSGPAATYGVSSSNAVKMRSTRSTTRAASTAARSGWWSRNTQYQVPRAVQAGAKLINRDRIFAMVAPLGTPMNNALFQGPVRRRECQTSSRCRRRARCTSRSTS